MGSITDSDGFHGCNSLRLLGAIGEVMPKLKDWLHRTRSAGADAAPDFIVSHTGSPKVLDAIVEGLGTDPELFGLARDSLREVGNLGSVPVLEVLERTFMKPPRDGVRGLTVAVGPGVSAMALKGVWHSGD